MFIKSGSTQLMKLSSSIIPTVKSQLIIKTLHLNQQYLK